MRHLIDNKDEVKLLEKHFDTALETPDGVKKLRELILTLAMQGKLVKQDERDQPASELLSTIDTEKNRLYKIGKIKKLDPLPEIKKEDIKYPAPKGWVWCNICAISYKVTDGEHITPKRTDSGYFLLSARNVTNEGILLEDVDFVPKYEFERIRKRCDPEIGDILISCSGSVGRIAIVDNNEYVMVRSAAMVKHAHEFVNSNFLAYSLRSPMAQLQIIQKSKTTAQSNLFIGKIKEILIPLPPLAEQKRIVAKIDQLMTLCDKLETERNERSNKRLKIHTAAINKLLTAPDKSEFNSSWNFITKNFSELYSVKENAEELKKAILQLAVMGKLVPQDSKDQPAGELLKEIEGEKNRLVKEGKIRNIAPLEPIKDVPYEIPSNWKWVRLIDIAEYNGRPNAAPTEIDQDTWVLDLEDIEKDTSNIIARAKYKDRQSKSTKSTFCKGDVLYGKLRPYLNKVVVADSDGVCTTEIVPIVPYKGIDSFFLKHILMRPSFIEHVNALSYGVKMPRLGTSDAINSIHPLPPLAEQKRIVTKIDQLMSLCNLLVQQVSNSTDKQTAILNAVLAKI